MSDKQTKIPTVEETNSQLSAPVRSAGYVEPEQEEGTQGFAVEAKLGDPKIESVAELKVESNDEQSDEAPEALACDQCDFETKNANGLKSHQRTQKAK